jgi:signal peptidase I
MTPSDDSTQPGTPTGTRPSGSASDLLTGVEPERRGGWRETIESFAIAFILAFVFKTFEAEAFVIPTGSMAPTLYGRHKDVDCEACGHNYAVGASEELHEDWYQPNLRLTSSYCPNCRNENDIKDLPVFKGDRILVNKFPYEFGLPKRWDVTVFKFPEQPNVNYIKRMVGLPNETIVIRQGNLYVANPDGSRQILRKSDPDKQDVLQLPVFDNDHPETGLHTRGWPSRWSAVERDLDNPRAVAGWSESKTGWTVSDDARSFSLAASKQLNWLKYRHFVPEPETWNGQGAIKSLPRPRPRLITDFCGYNTYEGGHLPGRDQDCYWVGDLTLSCEIHVEQVGESGLLWLELIEGRRRFRAEFDLAKATVRMTSRIDLNRDEEEQEVLGQAQGVRLENGRHTLRFANVDDRLCLWVDGNLVELGPDVSYRQDATDFPGPGIDDLAPVGIAAQDARLTVSHLGISRDIYYRSEVVRDPDTRSVNPPWRDESSDQNGLLGAVADPRTWHQRYSNSAREAVFRLGPDEFLMLGDNSPKSKDGRLWGNSRGATRRHAVPRKALVGKAFYIYWPHGLPFFNDGQGFPGSGESMLRRLPILNRWFYHAQIDVETRQPALSDYPQFRVPFYPQFQRMKRIR